MKYSELKASINQVISFIDVENILNEVRKTSSTNMKIEILNKNKENDLLAKILEYTYNPHKRYGISEKLVLTPSSEDIPKEKDIFKMLDKLANNNINDSLRTEFANFLEYYDAIAKLLRQVVNKDLKLGCNVNTINKVWDGLIPTSETGIEIKPMLASKFDFDKPPKGQFYVSEKLDGIRCLAICKEDSVELYTRQGKLIEGCLEIEDDLKKIRKITDEDFVLDGEILANDCDYETVYKETTKRVKNKNAVKTDIHYVVFDLLTYDEFINKKCTHAYSERISELQKIDMYFMKNKRLEFGDILTSVEIINSRLFDDGELDKVMDLLNIYRKMGAEGLMLNLADAPYEFKRSKNILKVKVMQTVDLRIVGFEEGQGRNAGKLGALLVEYKGNTVGVGSGFSDHEREFIWKNQSMYLDKICEIQYFEETKNKDGGVSLRFPVWKHLRLDKDEPSLF